MRREERTEEEKNIFLEYKNILGWIVVGLVCSFSFWEATPVVGDVPPSRIPRHTPGKEPKIIRSVRFVNTADFPEDVFVGIFHGFKPEDSYHAFRLDDKEITKNFPTKRFDVYGISKKDFARVDLKRTALDKPVEQGIRENPHK